MVNEENPYEQRVEISPFLAWMAGLDRKIFSLCDSSTKKRYWRSAWVMVFIGIMAGISGFYTFYLIFGSLLASIPFACIWSIIIINLYQLVLVTVGTPYTQHAPPYEFPFGSFLFRTVFLLMIGIFIAKPIELIVFSGPISQTIKIEKLKAKDNYDAKWSHISPTMEPETQNGKTVSGKIFSGPLPGNADGQDHDRRVDESGYLVRRLIILHEKFPQIWWLTIILELIFIYPFLARIRLRTRSIYEQHRGKIEYDLVQKDYLHFKAMLIERLQRFSKDPIVIEEAYLDPPFNLQPKPKEEREVLRKGSLWAWAKIHAKERPSA